MIDAQMLKLYRMHNFQDEKLSALLWTTFQSLTSEIPARIIFMFIRLFTRISEIWTLTAETTLQKSITSIFNRLIWVNICSDMILMIAYYILNQMMLSVGFWRQCRLPGFSSVFSLEPDRNRGTVFLCCVSIMAMSKILCTTFKWYRIIHLNL